jgi:hypothetical protein
MRGDTCFQPQHLLIPRGIKSKAPQPMLFGALITIETQRGFISKQEHHRTKKTTGD